MLKVRTRIDRSRIHGIGLFAAQEIPEGAVIWEFDPPFDVLFRQADFDRLPEAAKEHVRKYSYFDAAQDRFVLCGDDARFMNHSQDPSTSEVSSRQTVAARRIAVGEELTCDYAQLGEETVGLKSGVKRRRRGARSQDT